MARKVGIGLPGVGHAYPKGVGGGPAPTFLSVLGSGSPNTNTLTETAASQYYGQIGGANAIGSKVATEAPAQRSWRAGIIKEGAALVTQQTRLTGNCSWRTRINGADGTVIVVIPGGAIATGSSVVYSDTTHTDAIADGDLVCNAIYFDAIGSGFLVNPHIGYTYETTGSADTYLSGAPATVTNYSTTALRHLGMTGLGAQATVDCAVPAPVAGTLSRLQMHLTVAGTAPKAFSTRINGVAGQCTVPLTSTGLLEDTTHTDAVALDDLIVHQLLGTGTTPQYDGFGCRFSSTTSGQAPVLAHGASGGQGGNGVAPANFWSGFNTLRRNNVEGEARNAIQRACVVDRLGVRVSANTNVGDLSLVVRRAAGTLNGVTVITALATGVFTDTTHTDAFAQGDAITTMSPQGQDTGTIFQAISWRQTIS